MKNTIGILILLIVIGSDISKAQSIREIRFPNNDSAMHPSVFNPDTGELLNPNNLTDIISEKIKDLYIIKSKDIYFEFTSGDTINEFFFLNDSTYTFRQKIMDTISIRGKFNLIIRLDTFVQYRPGIYDPVVNIYKYGILEMSKDWYYVKRNLWGKYDNGLKVGTWKQNYKNEIIEFKYWKGDLIGIVNPQKSHIKNNINWLKDREMKFCLNSDIDISKLDTIEIVSEYVHCSNANFFPELEVNPKQNKKQNEIRWRIEEDGTITINKNGEKEKFRIIKFGNERSTLVRKEQASR